MYAYRLKDQRQFLVAEIIKFFFILMVIILLLVSTSAVANEATDKALLTSSCTTCHIEGSKTVPSIKSLSTSAMEKALLDFRAGKRPSKIMEKHMQGFSVKQIKLIAQTLGVPE